MFSLSILGDGGESLGRLSSFFKIAALKVKKYQVLGLFCKIF
jgi:hypothetical protein